MFFEAFKQLKIAFILLVLMAMLTGIFYPASITGIAQTFFPWRANGSLILQHGKVIGSNLIGQFFTDPKYFWGRPSATMPFPYNAEFSSGSNAGPLNADFLATVKSRADMLVRTNPQAPFAIPVDLITASGSGLDPDISLYAAYYQAQRISLARKITLSNVYRIIASLEQKRYWGVLGEARVNVLALNLALDNINVI